MPPMQGTDLQRIYNGIITDLQRSSRNCHHLPHNTHHPQLQVQSYNKFLWNGKKCVRKTYKVQEMFVLWL